MKYEYGNFNYCLCVCACAPGCPKHASEKRAGIPSFLPFVQAFLGKQSFLRVQNSSVLKTTNIVVCSLNTDPGGNKGQRQQRTHCY